MSMINTSIARLFALVVISSGIAAIGHAQTRLGTLSSLDNNARPVPLPIDQAFPWFVSETAPGEYQVTFEIAPDHYLYRHAFRFELQTAADQQPEELAFDIPAGLSKVDQFFGRIEAYYTRVAVDLQFDPGATTEPSLILEFQGCAEWGFCYPPQRVTYTLPR